MSTRIRRDVIDGVTVFWTPDAKRRMGALQFRVGQSDETPSTAGVSHIVEHLALFSTERRQFCIGAHRVEDRANQNCRRSLPR
jgi:predicted Zn-dependent peptidase